MALPQLIDNKFVGQLGAAIVTAPAQGTVESITTTGAASAILQGSGQFYVMVDAEIMLVTAGATGTSWTVIRGCEGTSTATHTNGTSIFGYYTAETMLFSKQPDALQSGVVGAGDGAVSGISVNSGSGAISATVASGIAWVKEPVSSALIPNAIPSMSSLTPGSLPASGKYAVVGIDLVARTGGAAPAIALSSKGTDQTSSAAALNNSPAAASGRIRLWDVVILNTAGSYSLAANRDRRPWARGAYARITRYNGANYTLGVAGYSAIDSTNIALRMELSGVPVRLSFWAAGVSDASASQVQFAWVVTKPDGTTDNVGQDGSNPHYEVQTTANVLQGQPVNFTTPSWIPTAGSNLIIPNWKNSAGTATLASGTSNNPVVMVVEEILRQNANNGTS